MALIFDIYINSVVWRLLYLSPYHKYQPASINLSSSGESAAPSTCIKLMKMGNITHEADPLNIDCCMKAISIAVLDARRSRMLLTLHGPIV